MKKRGLTVLATYLAASCLAGLVFAGPENIPASTESSGKDLKEVVPMSTPCPSWTGFYVGAFGGYTFGDDDPSLHLGGDFDDPFFNQEVAVLQSRLGRDLDIDGAHLGGQFGYNYQWHNWVFGAEAAGSYLWVRDSDTSAPFIIPSNLDVLHTVDSLQTHYLGTFGPRIGYSFCRWMPFVTGGLAVGDIEFKQQIVEDDFFFHEGGSTHETNVGWMVGGGLEYLFSRHWSAKVQYQHVDLGSVAFAHRGVGSQASGFTGRSEVDFKEHNASFALSYHF